MDKECIVNNFASAIGYHEKKVGEGVAELVTGSGFLQGDAIEKAVDFEYTNSLNDRLKLKGFDIPFSFDKTDQVSDDKMLEILQDFKDDMGFNDRPFLLYKHEDTDNLHYHLVVANTDWNGKTNGNMRGFYRREATLLARKYESKYNLKELGEVRQNKTTTSQKEINALQYTIQNAIKKGLNLGSISMPIADEVISKPLSNSEIKLHLGDKYIPLMDQLYKLDLLKRTKKTQLINALSPLVERHFQSGQSLESFFVMLREKSFYVREMQKTSPRRITYGMELEGEMFYCSSKSLPDRFSYKALLNGPQTNFTVDQQKSFLKNQISKVRKVAKSYNEFKQNLKKIGITVHEISNDKFGIYALKYSSDNAEEKVQFSASELNKDFSFAKLAAFYSVADKNMELDRSKDLKSVGRDAESGSFSSSQVETGVAGLSQSLNSSAEGVSTKKAKKGDEFEKKKGKSR